MFADRARRGMRTGAARADVLTAQKAPDAPLRWTRDWRQRLMYNLHVDACTVRDAGASPKATQHISDSHSHYIYEQPVNSPSTTTIYLQQLITYEMIHWWDLTYICHLTTVFSCSERVLEGR